MPIGFNLPGPGPLLLQRLEPLDAPVGTDYLDSATVLVDIQADDVEVFEATDSATVSIDIQVGTFAPAVITVDQLTLGTNTNLSGAGQAISLVTTQPVAAGATIVLGIVDNGDTTPLSSVSGGGLTWTIDRNVLGGDTGGTRIMFATALAPVGLAAGATLTASWPGGFTGNGLFIAGMSFLGMKTTSPLDGSPPVKTSVNGITAWSTNTQAIQAGSVMVGVLSAGSTTGTNTPDSPQLESTEYDDVANSNAYVMQYRIEPNAGTYAISGVFSATANVGAANVAYLVATSVPVDIAQWVETAEVYVDIQASGPDTYTPGAGATYTDADTVLVDIQASSTEAREATDAATVPILLSVTSTEAREVTDAATPYVDIQASGTELRELTDATTVLVDIQTSAVELLEATEVATVLVDIQTSAVDILEVVDSAEVYVDIQPSGVDTYVPPAVLAAYVIQPPYIV
jgi:hypothetical protein